MLEDVTVQTRRELVKVLATRFHVRVWDEEPRNPSFRDAAVLLTPPFNTGSQALKLTKVDRDVIPPSSGLVAPATDEAVMQKLDGV